MTGEFSCGISGRFPKKTEGISIAHYGRLKKIAGRIFKMIPGEISQRVP